MSKGREYTEDIAKKEWASGNIKLMCQKILETHVHEQRGLRLGLESWALHAKRLALKYHNKGEPYKAMTMALIAGQFDGLAMSVVVGDQEKKRTPSVMGKKGANNRHKRDRAAKAKAIEIYQSKSWPSLAQAARTIGPLPEVNKTEAVVAKWLRPHRHTNGKAGAAS